MNTVIAIQRELLQQELENLRVRGNLLYLCLELKNQDLPEDAKNRISDLIEKYKLKDEERAKFLLAMGMDYANIGESEDPVVQIYDKEWEEKQKNKPVGIDVENLDYVSTGNLDSIAAGAYIPKGRTNDPERVVLKSITESGFVDKQAFIDQIEGMTYSEFEKFCNLITQLSYHCTITVGNWMTEDYDIVKGHEDKFWKVEFFGDDDEDK